ncbi:hypothetical protein GCM10020367_65410 [Streptomyces sannanensis]|uniref:Transposase IS4-like domain-containing protein n=1 Tax=Streptomyces sannanensis TaxID=285536 RepID=A0ABP6SLI3_9ACTN
MDGPETCPASTRGYDGGKMRDGRKRHILTNSGGLLLEVTVTAGNVHDSQAPVRGACSPWMEEPEDFVSVPASCRGTVRAHPRYEDQPPGISPALRRVR